MTREQAKARADRVLEVWAKETNGTVYKGGIDWNKGTRLIADALIEVAQESAQAARIEELRIGVKELEDILEREPILPRCESCDHWKTKAEARSHECDLLLDANRKLGCQLQEFCECVNERGGEIVKWKAKAAEPERKLEAGAEDTARLDWAQKSNFDWMPNGSGTWLVIECVDEVFKGDSLREAIDSARGKV